MKATFKPPYHNRLIERFSIFLDRFILSRDIELRIEEESLENWRAVPPGSGLFVAVKHAHYTDHFSIAEIARRLHIRCYFISIPESFREFFGLGGAFIRALGAFPIERGGENFHAARFIVNALRKGEKPLVIFPEGELYFLNDVVTPLKPGLALFALEGAKARSTYILPIGLKYLYPFDAKPLLLRKLSYCEKKVYGTSFSGEVLPRLLALSETVLASAEKKFGVNTEGKTVEERFLSLSKKLLEQMERKAYGKIFSGDSSTRIRKLMIRDPKSETAFFAIHSLAFLPGYLDSPTQERLMETLRKLERLISRNEHPSFPGRKKLFLKIQPAVPVDPHLPAYQNRSRRKEVIERLSEDVRLSLQNSVDSLCKKINSNDLQ